jgi:hypothetical protein
LDNVHGLSIYFPLGTDLVLTTTNLHMSATYTLDELQFVADTKWKALINKYYVVRGSPVPTSTTEGHVDGVQIPDVTPPTTTMTITGILKAGQAITVTWAATDTQTGVVSATLWHMSHLDPWTAVMTQTGSSGVFLFTLHQQCPQELVVRATDHAGNIESFDAAVRLHCLYLPAILKNK